MLEPLGFEVKGLVDYPELPDVEEDGETFAENALKKAREIAEQLGVPALADDSGLTVDSLDGAPGVYSARYSGEHGNDAANNEKLLRELARVVGGTQPALGHPQAMSRGRFVCALALYNPDGTPPAQTEAYCEGLILQEPRGEHGFGYDPLFYVPELGRTMAELTTEEKNRISHRAKALQAMKIKLEADNRLA